MSRVLLEAACGSLRSALAAQAGGADRIELCSDLAAGGTTPSAGTVALVRERVRLPLMVLVRPRAGDFVHDDDETENVLRDIASCRALGCDGIVTGALTSAGEVDEVFCRAVLQAAGPLPVTFHRAFDQVADRAAGIETLVRLGITRVLTSGGRDTALAGSAQLADDVRRAAGRLTVIAAAGITPGNVAEVVARSACREVHASASQERISSMRSRHTPAGLALEWRETDAATVAALRARLQAIAGCLPVH